MNSPLFEDLRAQRPGFQRLLSKALLFAGLMLLLDRGLGAFLKCGLERYYGLSEPASVLCVGHSHVVLGIDKVKLQDRLGVPVAKFAVEGANTGDRLAILRYYLSRQTNSVRAVVYGVDSHSFTDRGLSSASYRLLFPFMDNALVGAYIKAHCADRLEYWLRRTFLLPRFSEFVVALSARGWLGNWSNFKTGQVDVGLLRQAIEMGSFRKIELDPDNLRIFNEIIQEVRRHGAVMVLVYIPTIDVVNQLEPKRFEEVMQVFKGFASRDPGIVFLDYNSDYQTRHELFFDRIHLNRAGQQIVTDRLVDDLRAILKTNRGNGAFSHSP